MRASGFGLLVILAVASAGCALTDTPGPKSVAGPTDGYTPASSHLKVFVRSNASGEMVLLDFDRRDWHVAGIAQRLDGHALRFLTAEATPRAILGEYLVQRVVEPADLEAYRYSAMSVSEEERLALDAEYDTLLARFAPTVPAPEAPRDTLADLPPPPVG